MKNIILTSSFPPAYPVIYDRRNGHRWFFAIVFCHPPSFFLSTLSSGFLFFFIQTVSCLLSACRDVKTIIFYAAVHVCLLHKNIWIFLDTPNNRDWSFDLDASWCVDDESMGWLVSPDGCHASAITTRLLAKDKAATGYAFRHRNVKKPVRPDLAVSTPEWQRDERCDWQALQDTVVHRIPQQQLHGCVLSVWELCGRRIHDQVQGSSTVQTILTVSGRLYLLP